MRQRMPDARMILAIRMAVMISAAVLAGRRVGGMMLVMLRRRVGIGTEEHRKNQHNREQLP